MSSGIENYLVPVGSASAELEIKKNIFIASLTSASNKSEALDFIKLVRTKYDDARHHCWVYIVGNPLNPNNAGASDDGEPCGSASKPIMNVVTQNRVGNVVIVVTRYFSGVKLGIGGLVRAYSQASSLALKNVLVNRFWKRKILGVSVAYNLEGVLSRIANKMGATINSAQYDTFVTFEIEINENIYDDFIRSVLNSTRGKVVFKEIKSEF